MNSPSLLLFGRECKNVTAPKQSEKTRSQLNKLKALET